MSSLVEQIGSSRKRCRLSLFLVDFISSSSSFSVLASTIPVAVAPCLVCSIANGRYGPSFGSGTHLLTPQFIYRYLIISITKRLCYSLCGILVGTNNFLGNVKSCSGKKCVFGLLVTGILNNFFQNKNAYQHCVAPA